MDDSSECSFLDNRFRWNITTGDAICALMSTRPSRASGARCGSAGLSGAGGTCSAVVFTAPSSIQDLGSPNTSISSPLEPLPCRPIFYLQKDLSLGEFDGCTSSNLWSGRFLGRRGSCSSFWFSSRILPCQRNLFFSVLELLSRGLRLVYLLPWDRRKWWIRRFVTLEWKSASNHD